MKESTTIRDRLTDTLLSQPWGLNPTQLLDFTAWMLGIEMLRLQGLHQLSNGEVADVVARLDNCTMPETLREQWFAARIQEGTGKTLAQINEEALAWLR